MLSLSDVWNQSKEYIMRKILIIIIWLGYSDKSNGKEESVEVDN